MGSLISAALARAQEFLLEPAPPAEPPTPAAAAPLISVPPPISVAVTGLGRGCGASTVAAGLSLAAGSAPVAVRDVGAGDAGRDPAMLGAPDVVVCVADASCEPALCSIVRDLLGRRHRAVLVVANRVRAEDWTGRCDVWVPESRLATALLARGRLAGGAFGRAFVALAARVELCSPA